MQSLLRRHQWIKTPQWDSNLMPSNPEQDPDNSDIVLKPTFAHTGPTLHSLESNKLASRGHSVRNSSN